METSDLLIWSYFPPLPRFKQKIKIKQPQRKEGCSNQTDLVLVVQKMLASSSPCVFRLSCWSHLEGPLPATILGPSDCPVPSWKQALVKPDSFPSCDLPHLTSPARIVRTPHIAFHDLHASVWGYMILSPRWGYKFISILFSLWELSLSGLQSKRVRNFGNVPHKYNWCGPKHSLNVFYETDITCSVFNEVVLGAQVMCL